MKYRHVAVVKVWDEMTCDEECVWLDSMSDSNWELVSSEFVRSDHSGDAPQYLTPDVHVFRYVFRTPRKEK